MEEENWTLSAELAALLKDRLADPQIATFTSADFTYYPIILWSLGSALERPGHEPIHYPPSYSLGLNDSLDFPDVILIPETHFGYVMFRPSDEDKNSARRTVHYDGTDIVVR